MKGVGCALFLLVVLTACAPGSQTAAQPSASPSPVDSPSPSQPVLTLPAQIPAVPTA